MILKLLSLLSIIKVLSWQKIQLIYLFISDFINRFTEVFSKLIFDYVFHLSKKTGETFLDTFIFQISFKPLFSILLGIQKNTMQCK